MATSRRMLHRSRQDLHLPLEREAPTNPYDQDVIGRRHTSHVGRDVVKADEQRSRQDMATRSMMSCMKNKGSVSQQAGAIRLAWLMQDSSKCESLHNGVPHRPSSSRHAEAHECIANARKLQCAQARQCSTPRSKS